MVTQQQIKSKAKSSSNLTYRQTQSDDHDVVPLVDGNASAKRAVSIGDKKSQNAHRLVKSHGFISERIHHGHRQDDAEANRARAPQRVCQPRRAGGRRDEPAEHSARERAR